MLIAVDAGYFYAGIIVKDGRIRKAAPILRWGIGKLLSEFETYANKKKWRLIDVDENQ